MKKKTAALLLLAILALSPAACRRAGADRTPEELDALARCLTKKGWVMYGRVGCSGCLAQQKAFGRAWDKIVYIECDPHEPGNKAPQCVERNIRKTPTWVLEVDGKEVKRLEQYQLLEDLAQEADCDHPKDKLHPLPPGAVSERRG